jgi:hypothetical protein
MRNFSGRSWQRADLKSNNDQPRPEAASVEEFLDIGQDDKWFLGRLQNYRAITKG